MLTYDPFYKPAKTYRSTQEAFRDAEYASWFDCGERNYSPKPYSVAALTAIIVSATIVLYLWN